MNPMPLPLSCLRPLSLLAVSASLAAQEARIVERDAHQQRVEVISTRPGENGVPLSVTNSYVQLETGLNFRNAKGEWEESKAEFTIENGWAVARRGQHQVALYHNLNADGAVVLRTPDGKRLRSHVYGLAYFDTASGRSVLIAAVKDSQAQLLDANVLIYPDAFIELAADVRYTYTKGGFEQDIILREKPPGPEKFGFLPETTRLEVWTEFVEAERPRKQAQLLNPDEVARGAEARVDEALGFGELGIGQGRTFRLGQEDPALSLVAKNWIETEDGGKFLVETVAVDSIEAGLEALPAKAGGAGATHAVHPGRLHAGYRPPKRAAAKEVGQAAIPRLDRARDLAQLNALSRPGLVLDYVTTNSGVASNFAFRSDYTHFISGPFTVSGTTTFEGGTVIKYANTGSPSINVSGTLVWRADMYRPVIMTAKDDNTVGEVIVGSTGAPSGYYATRALNLTGSATTAMTLQHFRIAHAATALGANNFTSTSYPLTVRHGQIVNCGTAYTFGYGSASGATFKLQNQLLFTINRVFENLYGAWVQGDHLTIDGGAALNYNPSSSTLVLNNSLITAVTTTTGYTGTATTVLSSATGVFSNVGNVGGGKHYLAGDTYRNSAIFAVETTLADDLKRMTTYPPEVIATAIKASSRLAPQATLDKDTLDRGYHYPPVDYLVSTLQVNKGALTLADGVVMAYTGTSGLWLQAGTKLISRGLPDRLNTLARYTAVQEVPAIGAPAHTSGFTLITSSGAAAGPPTVDASFTALAADHGDFHLYADGATSGSFPLAAATLRDCQLFGGKFQLNGANATSLSVSLFNNLWVRTYLRFDANVSVSAFNQLWWRCLFEFFDGTGVSTIRNSVFDNTTLTVEETTIGNSYNGYVPTAAVKLPASAGFDQTAATFTYATPSGGFGDWYHSSTDFQNDGNQSAIAAGLTHYTTLANQTKDTGNVDLGFHYVVANTSTRLALDSDGDSLRDYLEDADGDNVLDTGETSHLLADSDRDGRTDAEELTDNTDPRIATSAKKIRLGRWLFDNPNNWNAETGQLPLVNTFNGGPLTVTGFSGQAASFVLDSGLTARQLNYKWAEANSKPNLTFGYGSVRFWFKPSWASANRGGSGPGGEARLLNLGIPVTTTSGNGWWAVYVEPNGNQLTVGSQAPSTATQIKLSADISWKLNTWHFIEVSYDTGAQKTFIYVDGQLVKTGAAPAASPNTTALNLGFAVGSDMNGGLSAKGRIDRLETFNYPQAEEEHWAEYKAITSVDTDNDLLSDVLENEVGSLPSGLGSADTDGDLMKDGWEYFNGFNPLSPPGNNEANLDSDGDLVSNLTEHNNGTDPRDNDTEVRAPVPVVADTFQRALDQKHLISLDFGALNVPGMKTVVGPKAAGFDALDKWDQVKPGPQTFVEGLPKPDLLKGDRKLTFVDGTESRVTLWSGYGPCYEPWQVGFQNGSWLLIPRVGIPSLQALCTLIISTTCWSGAKSREEVLACIEQARQEALAKCVNEPIFWSPQPGNGDSFRANFYYLPSFDWTTRSGVYFTGINDLMTADPGINTVDDQLVAFHPKAGALLEFDQTEASTRTVLSGLKPKPYRLYVRGVFAGVLTTPGAEVGADPNVKFTAEVAGARRYLVQPPQGTVTLLGNQSLSWLQLVELEPLPSPALISPTLVSYSAVRLTWGQVVTAETYRVYRREGGGNYALVTTTADLGFVDGTVKNGTTYTYYVVAQNEAYESDKSGTVTVTTPAAHTSLLHNRPPTLTRPEPIQFAEHGQPFKLTMSQLLAATRASDPEGQPIGFRLDFVPAGQVLKRNGQALTLPLPAPLMLASTDVLEWTAPSVSSEDGIEAFHVSAHDGFRFSDNPVAIPIVVKGPSALYGWGYSGVANLPRGTGKNTVSIAYYGATGPAVDGVKSRHSALAAGFDVQEIMGQSADLVQKVTRSRFGAWNSAISLEPIALAQLSGGTVKAIQSVRRVVPGLLTMEGFSIFGNAFGLANAVLRNDGQALMWGFDYRKGLFGPTETELYADANYLPEIGEPPRLRDWPNNAYLYDTATPLKISNGAGGHVIWDQIADLSLSSQHALAVTHTGQVYSWGADDFQIGKWVTHTGVAVSPSWKLGMRANHAEYWTGFDRFGVAHDPLPVAGLSGITAVLADHFASFALAGDGTVWYWGTLGDYWVNEKDWIGMPVNPAGLYLVDPSRPRRLEFAGVSPGNEPKIRQMAGNGSHYVFLDTAGNVWEFGYLPRLRIAAGSRFPQAAHYRFAAAEMTPGATLVKKVAAGREYLLALQENGSLLEWGALYHSESLGRRSETAVPRLLTGLPRIKDMAVSPGDEHDHPGHFDPMPWSYQGQERELQQFALACDENGAVWAWGSNAYGVLGDEDRNLLTDVPQKVSGMADAVSVAAGHAAAFAVARHEDTVPVGLKAVAGNQQVTLTWRRFFNAADYVVERSSEGPLGAFMQVGIASGNSYRDLGVLNGQVYAYRVVARRDGMPPTAPSEVVKALPMAPPALAPANVLTIPVCHGVEVRWDSVNGATGFRLYRSGGANAGSVVVGEVDATLNFFVDQTVVPGPGNAPYEYVYRVAALNHGGVGPASAPTVGSNANNTLCPDPPGNLVASTQAPTTPPETVDLSWSAPGLPPSGDPVLLKYIVKKRYKDAKGARFQIVAEIPNDQLTYQDTGLLAGAPLAYTVSAIVRLTSGGVTFTVEREAAPVEAIPYGVGVPKSTGIDELTAQPIRVLEEGAAAPKTAVFLSWKEDPSARYYTVERTQGSTTVTVTQEDHRYLDTTVTGGVTYGYRVRAVGTGSGQTPGDGPWTPAAGPLQVLAPNGSATAVPKIQLITSGYDQSILLKWPPQPLPATQYPAEITFLLGRMLSPASNPTYRAITEDPPAYGLSFVDDGLLNGTEYKYRILAFDSSKALLSWSELAADTPEDPVTVWNLAANPGNAHVRLTWSAQAATAYKVRVSTEPGGPSTQVTKTPDNFYYHTGLQNGQTYYYTVTATVDGAGDVQTSPELSATPLATLVPLPPRAPLLTFSRSAAPSGSDVLSAVSWKGVDGAIKYEVERGLTAAGSLVPPTTWTSLGEVSDSYRREKVAATIFEAQEVWYRIRSIGATVQPNNAHKSDWTTVHRTFDAPEEASANNGMVTLVSPPHGSTAVTPTNLVLRATTKLTDLIRVEFYDGDTRIGLAESEPWQAVYHNVPSGTRELRAYAVDKAFNGEYSDPVTVTVQWASPLNDYQTAATDLTIPATGLAPSLDRSYDSGRISEPGAELGALGRGWRASWDQAKLVVGNGGDLGSGWAPGALLDTGVYTLVETADHSISITLPDGSEVAFSARLETAGAGDPVYSPITSLVFDPADGNSGSLTGGTMLGLGIGVSGDYASGGSWPDAGPVTLYANGCPAVDADVDLYTRPAQFTYVSPDRITYVFENLAQTGANWRLQSVTDRNGHSLSYSYDAYNRVTAIDHDGTASSRDINFTYVPAVPSGNTETIEVYDPIESTRQPPNLVNKKPVLKYVVSTTGGRMLKEVHRLTRRKDTGINERYEVVRYNYGTGTSPADDYKINRLISVEAGTKRYGPSPAADEVADLSGMLWFQALLNTYSSNSDPALKGKLSAQTDARGNTSTLAVNSGTQQVTAQSTVTGTVGGNTVTETVQHNASGEITAVTQAGETTQFTYNEKGLPLTETKDGKTKTYIYDQQDRLMGVTDETGKGALTAFNLDGTVDATWDANGNPTAFSYDAQGNLETSVDSIGTVTTRVYFTLQADSKWFGLVRRESRQVPGLVHPLVTDYEYSALGDLIREVSYIDQAPAPALGASPTGNYTETEYTYDGNGNRLTEKRWRTVNGSRVSATTTYAYDAQNRVLTTRDPLYASGTLRESLTTYDVYGRTAQTRDLLGNVTEMYYDPNGNLIQTIYPDGTLTRTVYDERNRPRYSQDRLVPANLVNCRLPDITTSTSGPGTETLYDAAGRTVGTRRWSTLTIEKAPFGASVTYIAKTTLTSTAASPYSNTRTVYDAAGRVKYSVDANGAVTESQYDDAGRRTKTLAYTAYQAPFNNFTTTLTPTGNTLVTTYGYDANGNQLWVLDAKGQSAVGANGPDTAKHQDCRTDFRYDEGNRRILTYFPLVEGDTTRKFRQTLYDSLGRRSVEFDEAGVATAFGYDNLGRLTSVTNDFRLVVPSGITLPVTRYEYDEMGNQIAQIDAASVKVNEVETRKTRYEYDALGRRTKRILPTVAAAANTYHLDESVAYTEVLSGSTYVEQRQVTAFNGRRLTFKHDKMGRLSQKTLELPASPAPPAAPTSWTTEATLDFTYAPQGWLKKVTETRTGVTDPRHTFFDYDAYGRLTKKDSPEGVLAYAYLPSGSVDTLKGYPRSVVAQPSTPATATDALALPGGAVPDVSLKYEYDRLGRLEKVSDFDGITTSIADSAKTFYAYDANGNLDSVRYPENGGLRVEHKYAYTAQNRLKQLDLQRVNPTTGTPSARIFSFLYRLNANGQRTAVIEDDNPADVGTSRAVQYVYDTDVDPNTPYEGPMARLSRLSREAVTTFDDGPQTFAVTPTGEAVHQYDLVGNRTYFNQNINGSTTLQPKYDNRDRLDYNSTATDANPNYDANGNTVKLLKLTLGLDPGDSSFNEAANDTGFGDTYDSENRLVKRITREVIPGNSANLRHTTIVLTYDHAGNRVSKVKTEQLCGVSDPYTLIGSPTVTTTTYLVDELNPTGYAQVVAEYQKVGSGALNWRRSYAYGLDLISQKLTVSGSTVRDYYGYDGHGSVRRLLTVSGARVMGTGTLPDYTYDAYGRLLATTETATPPRNLYRYAGEQWDPDLGLSYNRARYLSPNTGRFWSMDSYEGSQEDPASLHKYLYAHADPENNVDPSGYSDYSVIAQLAVSAFQKTLRAIKEVTPQLVKRRAKEFAKDFVEDKASEYLYILIIEPHMGPVFAYVGQSGALKERLEKHVKAFMVKYGDDVVVTVSHVIPFSTGDFSERTRKYIREGAEQLLLDTTRKVADDLGGTVGNVNNPVNLATAPARFRRHFKQGAKEWIRNLFTLTNRAG